MKSSVYIFSSLILILVALLYRQRVTWFFGESHGIVPYMELRQFFSFKMNVMATLHASLPCLKETGRQKLKFLEDMNKLVDERLQRERERLWENMMNTILYLCLYQWCSNYEGDSLWS